MLRRRRSEGHLQVQDEQVAAETQTNNTPPQKWLHSLYESMKAQATEMGFGCLLKWVRMCRKRIKRGFFGLAEEEEDEGGFGGRGLPEEILVDILLRVPFKTLLRCRCVCKTWASLISHPHFINLHLENVNNHIATTDHDEISDYVIFSNKESSSETFNFHSLCGHITKKLNFPIRKLGHYVPFVVRYAPHPCLPISSVSRLRFKVVGSCNGLLCLFSSDGVILWNPAINRIRVAELPKIGCRFDPAGLCFIPQTSDFKVVIVDCGYDSKPAKVTIYSTETNLWNEAACKSSDRWRIQQNFPTPSVEGALHWCAFKELQESVEQVILCFDAFEEVFREIVVPAPKVLKRIIEFQGTIACFLADSNERSWELWVMKEYGVAASWTRLCAFGYLHGIPLQIMNNGEVMVTSADGDGDIFLFDPATQNHGMEVEAKLGCRDVIAYKGSLALLNDNNRSRICWLCVSAVVWFCVVVTFGFLAFWSRD